jgi:hypothetical protein
MVTAHESDESQRTQSLARAKIRRETKLHEEAIHRASEEIKLRLQNGDRQAVADVRIDTEWGTLIALRPASIKTPNYQRFLKAGRVRRMAKDFDPRLYGVVLVTMREGKPSVIDGQHRIAAAIQAGHGDDPLPALVVPTHTYREEAELFVRANLRDTTVPVTPGEVFHARLEQGDERAEDIRRIVEGLGLAIDYTMQSQFDAPGNIRAIATVERLYKAGGPEHLADIFTCLKESFGDERGAYAHWMLQGFHQLLWRYHDILDRAHLAAALEQTSMQSLTARAMMRRIAEGGFKRVDSGNAIGRTVHDLYNEHPGARKLRDWDDAQGPKGLHLPEGALYLARPTHTTRRGS